MEAKTKEAAQKYLDSLNTNLNKGPQRSLIIVMLAQFADQQCKAKDEENKSLKLQLESAERGLKYRQEVMVEAQHRADELAKALELISRSLTGINDTITNDIKSIADAALESHKSNTPKEQPQSKPLNEIIEEDKAFVITNHRKPEQPESRKLPDDCLEDGKWSDIKFCSHRLTHGDKCRWCKVL